MLIILIIAVAKNGSDNTAKKLRKQPYFVTGNSPYEI
jgi:hypothetical protein